MSLELSQLLKSIKLEREQKKNYGQISLQIYGYFAHGKWINSAWGFSNKNK